MRDEFVKGNVCFVDNWYLHTYSYSNGKVMVKWNNRDPVPSIYTLDDLMKLVTKNQFERYSIFSSNTSVRNVK